MLQRGHVTILTPLSILLATCTNSSFHTFFRAGRFGRSVATVHYQGDAMSTPQNAAADQRQQGAAQLEEHTQIKHVMASHD